MRRHGMGAAAMHHGQQQGIAAAAAEAHATQQAAHQLQQRACRIGLGMGSVLRRSSMRDSRAPLKASCMRQPTPQASTAHGGPCLTACAPAALRTPEVAAARLPRRRSAA